MPGRLGRPAGGLFDTPCSTHLGHGFLLPWILRVGEMTVGSVGRSWGRWDGRSLSGQPVHLHYKALRQPVLLHGQGPSAT